ncbi:Cu+-exporting ATPase [Methanomicrobium sp. W14]|uniref:HAD-IC family P-type ATPase n=1 Tax=Methanomicrobium sp. W14 TaxID=2817839 RepID=UPI001AE60924|nr:HAD-IC family P-type ATPase [Methanomicrobium sp. W14]MBP2132911.1 Cu+-exporting ATPase [Methanomicrobium sp. W14]
MKAAIVFDSAGTLLRTYRIARNVSEKNIVKGVETTTLTCSEKGRALILLYAHSKSIIDAPENELLSSFLKSNKIHFGVACSCGVVTMTEISEILDSDSTATTGDLQACIRKVWNSCKKLPVVAMSSGVIVNKNLKNIEYTITSGGRPFSGAKKTIQTLQEMNIATYVASGDRTDKLLKMADYLGIPHGNVHGISTPSVKAQVVKDLKKEYDTVFMVGDGVNDIAAMKEADVSVLTEQQNSRKPKVLVESADHIIKEVSEVIGIAEKYIK